MNNGQDPAFHILLWDEPEYGNGVSFDPPLVFAYFQAAAEAAKTITLGDTWRHDRVYIVPVNLAVGASADADFASFNALTRYPYVERGELWVWKEGKHVKASA